MSWKLSKMEYKEEDEHSGGDIIYISPGLRYRAGNNINLTASVGVPIITDLNGFQSEPDYRIITGLNFNF